MHIYGDEGGYTGNQLLDDQDVYTYATVAIPPSEADELTKRLIHKYRLQGNEIRGRNLVKRPTGQKVVTEILQELEGRFTVAVNHKAFALSCKFFEYVFEPAISDSNSYFYQMNFHLYIGTVLYTYLLGKNTDAEALLQAFSLYARKGEIEGFGEVLPKSTSKPPENPLEAIGMFALLHRNTISEEMGRLHEGTPSWILDLTSTSVYHQLTRWSERFGSINVICDESKPLRLVKPTFDQMVGRTDQVHVTFHGKQYPYVFNLEEPVRLVDSKLYPGVQLADVIASAAAKSYSHFNRRMLTDRDQEWIAMLEKALVQPLWPELERFVPITKDGLAGMLILHELLRRSINGQNLYDGLPELIQYALNNRELLDTMAN
jgi:Protein of unknown function (DUF3800)